MFALGCRRLEGLGGDDGDGEVVSSGVRRLAAPGRPQGFEVGQQGRAQGQHGQQRRQHGQWRRRPDSGESGCLAGRDKAEGCRGKAADASVVI